MNADDEMTAGAGLMAAPSGGDGSACARHGAARRLAEAGLPMVRAMAKRFAGRGAEPEELLQAGAVGLMRAAEGYDAARGTSFASYAFGFIEGEMRAFLRGRSAIRLNRAALETAARANRLAAEIESKNGAECRLSELASAVGTDASELCAILGASMGCVSLDGGVDGGYALSDASAIGEYERAEDSVFLESLMECLSEKEKLVIRLRYFRDMTQTQTAERLGIGQAQVSRYERAALAKMRLRAAAADA